MQYILTEQEYRNLCFARDQKTQAQKDRLQALCTKIANAMPVPVGDGLPVPWGCMLDTPETWACDNCPVQEICPAEKKYSS